MQKIKQNGHYIAASLGIGGLLAAGLLGGGSPMFTSADSFVLLAKDQITIGSDLSHSSGNIGVDSSRGRITIGSGGSINGDIYANAVILGARNSANGSVFAKSLKKGSGTEILGETSTAFSSPLVSPFPTVPNFNTGSQNLTIRSNTTETIVPGSYRNITAGSNNTLTFPGGVYNIDRLTIGSNTTIVFQAPTTFNIRSTATFGSRTVFSPAPALTLEDIHINNRGSTITFGSRGFISGVITAPDANVTLGSNTTFRGQVLGRRVVVGSGAILGRGSNFEVESDPSKIVEDDGVSFVVNEIVALFSDDATFSDVESLAQSINGTIAGFVANPPTYKIRVQATTPAELYSAINQLKTTSGTLLIEAVPNLISKE